MGGGENLPIGPGIWGFVAFFVLAIALWLLVRNMNTRLRRMAYTDRDRARAEEQAHVLEGDGVRLEGDGHPARDGGRDTVRADEEPEPGAERPADRA